MQEAIQLFGEFEIVHGPFHVPTIKKGARIYEPLSDQKRFNLWVETLNFYYGDGLESSSVG